MRLTTVLILAALALVLPGAAHADVPVTAMCNGSGCSTGWYTTDVVVSFQVLLVHWLTIDAQA